MARVFQYVRPVNAVLTCVNLENRINLTENGIRIKEEPPDYDDSNFLSNHVDDTAESVSNDVDYQPSSVADNENSGHKTRTRSNRGKSSAPRRKRKRISDSDSDWEEVQQPKKQRLCTRATSHAQNKKDDDLQNKQNKVDTHLQNRRVAQLQNRQNGIETEAIFNCDICFVGFLSEKCLLTHKKLYKDVIMCQVCNVPFSTNRQLKRHSRTHSTKSASDLRVRPMCSLCKRKFSDKMRLQMHLFHCHRDVMCNIQAGQKYASTNGISSQVITDFDKFEETWRMKATTAADADKDKVDTCTEDTTTQAANDVDDTGRITRSRNGLLTTISDFDKFVGNIRIEDIIRRAQNDGDRLDDDRLDDDRLDDDICLEDTVIHTRNDRCEDDTGMEDTTIRLTKDAEEIENETCRKEPLIRVTNDVQKLEENIRMENAARRVAEDVDKIVEISLTDQDANDATVDAGLAEGNAATEEGTHDVVNTLVEDDTNPVINSAEEIEENTATDDNSNRVTNNAEEIEENTLVEDNTSGAINNADEMVENTPVKDNTSCVTNNADEIAQRVTENPDQKQRNKPAEATSSRPRRSVVKVQQSPLTATRGHLVAGIKSPSRSNTSTPVKKKMRQTTLTEFISFSGRTLMENGIKSERIDTPDESFGTNEQDTKNWAPGCVSTPIAQTSSTNDAATKVPATNTPLIRMHMNPDAIISLLNNQVKIEPVDNYSSPLAQSSSYNLRRSRRESCSSPFESCNASPATRPKSTITPKPRRAKLPLEERLRAKYNCKKCSVRLVRCDNTSKRVVFKTDRSKSVIPLQLMIENPERNSLNGKEKSSSPKIRIMTLDNCIVVELLEPI